MGRRPGGYVPFAPWESKKLNGREERYIRLGNSLLLDKGYQKLNHAAKVILSYMKLESKGNLEFEFPRHKYKQIISPAGFYKVLNELTEAGFVEIKERNKNRRIPNVYRFSDEWKNIEH